MNKAEFTDAVVSKVKDGDVKNKAAADRIIDAVFAVIKDEVVKGETVTIANFGTFKAVDKSEREFINPQTKEKCTAAAKKAPKFVPGKGFKDAVNQ